MIMRAARKDANHVQIAKEFERLGWIVLDLSQLKNCCDMAVTKEGQTIMIEAKNGQKPPSQRRLTDGELKFRNKWSAGGYWALIESIEDVQELDNRLEIIRFNSTDGMEDLK